VDRTGPEADGLNGRPSSAAAFSGRSALRHDTLPVPGSVPGTGPSLSTALTTKVTAGQDDGVGPSSVDCSRSPFRELQE
jgi:hypothetical protein